MGVDARRLLPIVHGSFLDYYPMEASREEARCRLGLPLDARVLTFVGHCRRYKNVTGLVAAFQQHVDGAWLVIAGNCPEPSYRAELEAMIRTKPQRIVTKLRYIGDADLQYFVRAADAVVLPFRDVLTSGSAILALSFGRPVVAPRLGNMVEVVNEDVGILYDPEDPEGLAGGMRAALARRFDQDAITRYAASLRWQDSAETVLAALREHE
jgi:beta-1,4-mannosyltransferase